MDPLLMNSSYVNLEVVESCIITWQVVHSPFSYTSTMTPQHPFSPLTRVQGLECKVGTFTVVNF